MRCRLVVLLAGYWKCLLTWTADSGWMCRAGSASRSALCVELCVRGFVIKRPVKQDDLVQCRGRWGERGVPLVGIPYPQAALRWSRFWRVYKTCLCDSQARKHSLSEPTRETIQKDSERYVEDDKLCSERKQSTCGLAIVWKSGRLWDPAFVRGNFRLLLILR